jgi:hypothetical protein
LVYDVIGIVKLLATLRLKYSISYRKAVLLFLVCQLIDFAFRSSHKIVYINTFQQNKGENSIKFVPFFNVIHIHIVEVFGTFFLLYLVNLAYSWLYDIKSFSRHIVFHLKICIWFNLGISQMVLHIRKSSHLSFTVISNTKIGLRNHVLVWLLVLQSYQMVIFK